MAVLAPAPVCVTGMIGPIRSLDGNSTFEMHGAWSPCQLVSVMHGNCCAGSTEEVNTLVFCFDISCFLLCRYFFHISFMYIFLRSAFQPRLQASKAAPAARQVGRVPHRPHSRPLFASVCCGINACCCHCVFISPPKVPVHSTDSTYPSLCWCRSKVHGPEPRAPPSLPR